MVFVHTVTLFPDGSKQELLPLRLKHFYCCYKRQKQQVARLLFSRQPPAGILHPENDLFTFIRDQMRLFKKILRLFGLLLAVLLLLIAGMAGYILFFLPNVKKAANLSIETSPARIKRGEYLANHVMACMSCHSDRNWNKPGAPMVAGTLGKGGGKFDNDSLGFFGDLYFPNITPFSLGSWTDGEIFRAITTGVDKNGKALSPIMPYEFYGRADAEDIKSIIAYLRSLPPIANTIPDKEVPLLFRVLNNLAPKEAAFTSRPSGKDTVAYGKYLSTVASCIACHSPFNGPGGIDLDHAFSGGPPFTMRGGRVTPINLTPDRETGIGLWTREIFLNKFRRYRDSSFLNQPIDPKKDFTSIMPWANFAGMKDEDLSAIYTYLRTLPPVHHKTDRLILHQQGRGTKR